MPQGSDPLSQALESALTRFGAMVRHVGFRHRLAGADLDEMLQDVRIRIWRALETGEKISAVSPSYLYRTATTAALDLIRRRRPHREQSLDETPVASLTLPAPDDTEEIARAVSFLGEGRRQVVRMYLAGYAREEIASLMGWTEARTRNLLYRGLADLRQRLQTHGIGPRTGH
jgi:RNA polymerase sigma factor (sigma-70 family)